MHDVRTSRWNGPAKWVAVCVLGLAGITGVAWSIVSTSWGIGGQARIVADASAPFMPAHGSPTRPERDASSQLVSSGGASRRVDDAIGEAEEATVPPSPVQPPASSRLININTASAAELELLPGIGPVLAQRIIADRDANGQFRNLDDLQRVRGIGPRTIERLRDLVAVQ